MALVDLLFGKPLSSADERGECIGAAAGVPIFGLDALSSAAYGPEAALTLLIVLGVHVDCEETATVTAEWQKFVEQPARELGLPVPALEIIPSPYRFIINPIVDFVLGLQEKEPARQIAVVIPEMIERHWYYHFLHNQRAAVLKALLYLRGSHRIAVINVPWHINF